MRWQTDVRHSGSPQRSQANGINQQRMHIAARFAVALEWQPSAACVCPCVCVCRYKCICRLLWIANGIEEWRRDKRAGRQIEWEIYCIHSLTSLHTHTHTHDQLYKLLYGNNLYSVYTDIPYAQLSRDRAHHAWQPFSLQLWQIVTAHTHSHKYIYWCWRVDALFLPLSLSLHCSI